MIMKYKEGDVVPVILFKIIDSHIENKIKTNGLVVKNINE